jgi:hypothetical protein
MIQLKITILNKNTIRVYTLIPDADGTAIAAT